MQKTIFSSISFCDDDNSDNNDDEPDIESKAFALWALLAQPSAIYTSLFFPNNERNDDEDGGSPSFERHGCG